MNGVNIAVLSEDSVKRKEIASALAKKENEDELGFYSTVFQGKIVSVVEPKAFPEKPETALFAANLADYCIIAGEKLTPRIGELIIALDLLEKKEGFILEEGIDWEKIVKGTALENWKRIKSIEEIKREISLIELKKAEGKPIAVVDHAFEVKGIGSIVLGVIKQGSIRVHDSLKFWPPRIPCEVKSIQVHDEDVKQADAGNRFGICFKGSTSKEVERGFLIAEETLKGKEISCEIEATKFLKEPLKNGEVLHACIGLQCVPCKIEVSEEIKAGEKKKAKISLQKEVAWNKGDPLVIIRLNSKNLRFTAKARL